MKRITVGLALSGGVVRGLAHVGVIRALVCAGIPIDVISGTSIGAFTGAIYAAGTPLDVFEAKANSVSWRHIASLTWSRRGFVSFAKLERWLILLIGDLQFQDLPKPFAVVATDLELGESIVLKDGRVAPAVRASCSVPGLIVPAEIQGRLLVDGGPTDNLPVRTARDLGADYVIGVDLFRSKLNPKSGPFGFGFAAIETMVRRAGGGIYQADSLIMPDLTGFSYLSFSRRREMMQRGEDAANKCIPTIRADLERLSA